MLDRLTGKPVHLIVHIVACSLIAAGLPASKIPLSVGTMLMLLNLLIEADFRTYFRRLKANRLSYAFWVYTFLTVLSLAWTSNFSYAGEHFRIALPLIAIPLCMIARPLTSKKHLQIVIGLFLASVFFTSVINVGTYQHWWGAKKYDDFRGLSLFSSHIRYALMVVMAFAVSVHWVIRRYPHRWLALLLSFWFLWYTNYAQVLSGYLVLGGIGVLLLIFLIRAIRKPVVKAVIAGSALIASAVGGVAIYTIMKPVPHKVSLENLPWYNENGRNYRHIIKGQIWENGYPVIAFINDEELAQAWNSVSEIDYETGEDAKKQPIDYTLWLYMTSKGLHKDSLGFLEMSATDVGNVELGYTSVLLVNGGWKARLYSIKHQLEHSENPNGHSLLQRIEYWKGAKSIISQNWLTGVGVGDVNDAFTDYYASSDTRLSKELQHRAHNQFFTAWIIAGIAGLIAFIAWWGTFFLAAWKKRHFLICSFAMISVLSFLVEDTLETQVGLTFAAFFYGLFAAYLTEKPVGKSEQEKSLPNS